MEGWISLYLLVGVLWAYMVWNNASNKRVNWAWIVAMLLVVIAWPWFLASFIVAFAVALRRELRGDK